MNVTIDIPEEVYREAAVLAESQHLSVSDMVSSVLTGHVAAWQRLQQRAARGNRDAFLRVLDKVPDVEPAEYDRL